MIATAPAARRVNPPLLAAPSPALPAQRVAEAARQADVTELDARGPTPPKPVPTILAALKAIPPGRPQLVRTAEAPVELLRALEAKGVEAYPTQMPDGSWRTLLICGAPSRA